MQRHLRDIRSSTRTARHTQRRRRLLITELPPPSLLRILWHLSVNDRLVASQTCRIIRQAALGVDACHLWSKISAGPKQLLVEPSERQLDYIDYEPPAWYARPDVIWSGVTALLERSGDTLARVSCAVDTSFPSAKHQQTMWRMLQNALSKSEYLRLLPFSWCHVAVGAATEWFTLQVVDCPSPAGWQTFAAALCAPAPFLRTLQLSVQESFTRTASIGLILPPTLLAGETHLLRTCYLKGITLPPGGCPAFSFLTVFNYAPLPALLSVSDLRDILLWMPQLHTLGVVVDTLQSDDMPALTTPHASLCRVAADIDLQGITAVFNFLHGQGISQIIIYVRALLGAGLHVHPQELPDLLLQPEAIYVDDNSAVLSAVDRRIVLSSWFWNDIVVDGYAFANLVSLTIASILWNEPPLPPAHKLKTLCILLPACIGGARFMEDYAGVFVLLPGQPAFVCPLLMDLHIAAEDRGPQSQCPRTDPLHPCTFSHRCTLELEDVWEFVTKGLSFGSSRLRQLRLSGIDAIVDPTPLEAYFSLLELADEVQVREEPSQIVWQPQRFSRYNGHAPTKLFNAESEGIWDHESHCALGTDPAGLWM